jgi:hypothetical protein
VLRIRGALDPPVANGALFPDEISFGPQNALRSWKCATSGVGTEGRRAYGVGCTSMERAFAGAEWNEYTLGVVVRAWSG